MMSKKYLRQQIEDLQSKVVEQDKIIAFLLKKYGFEGKIPHEYRKWEIPIG